MAPLRTATTVMLLMTAVPWLAGAAAGDSRLSEAQAKAGFLYNCAMFIDWPASAVRNGEIVIGIVGSDAIAGVIDGVAGRPVNGRTLRVKSVRPNDVPGDYQILFIGGDDSREAEALIAKIGDAPVLTVGEHPDFTARGGVVRLYTERERLRFEINMTRADRAGLHVSAKMLGLARIVRER